MYLCVWPSAPETKLRTNLTLPPYRSLWEGCIMGDLRAAGPHALTVSAWFVSREPVSFLSTRWCWGRRTPDAGSCSRDPAKVDTLLPSFRVRRRILSVPHSERNERLYAWVLHLIPSGGAQPADCVLARSCAVLPEAGSWGAPTS